MAETTCRAHCVRCNLCFGGSEAFANHLGADGHRPPDELKRLVGRPGTCSYTSYPAAAAGAAAYQAALDKARRVSQLAGRKGMLTRAELSVVHGAADHAEVGLPASVRVPTTVWGQKDRALPVAGRRSPSDG